MLVCNHCARAFNTQSRDSAAPKPFSRHIVVCSQPAILQHAPELNTAGDVLPTVYQNLPRESYPPEMLKHQFMPYGSLATIIGVDSATEDRSSKCKEGHKAKADGKEDVSLPSNTMDLLGVIPSKDVDETSKESEKKRKKGKRGEQAKKGAKALTIGDKVVMEPGDAVSPLVLNVIEDKTSSRTKRRKGDEEDDGEGRNRGKKSKKLKTKAS
ncbi:hypothetical protein AX17_001938 [Amanita inopinata Kibby_2008]|nr:hypothetical protein AX17_001938 [Amanita inopinata Kibby_2008]